MKLYKSKKNISHLISSNIKFNLHIIDKAYRPNAHLLYTVMHYNGNMI